MGFEKGEIGRAINRIEKKFSCPTHPRCPLMFDTEEEALQHFYKEHRIVKIEEKSE